MLPFAGPCSFGLFLALFGCIFPPPGLATSVVCVCFGGGGAVFALGVDFFVTVLAAIAATLDEERGGEGARPVDGANRAGSGSLRFSLGFLNMELIFAGRKACVGCVGLQCGGVALWMQVAATRQESA